MHSAGFDQYPATGVVGSPAWATSNAGGWTASFFPSTLLQLWHLTGNASLYAAANEYNKGLAANAHNTGTHDVGFMTASFMLQDKCQFCEAHPTQLRRPHCCKQPASLSFCPLSRTSYAGW